MDIRQRENSAIMKKAAVLVVTYNRREILKENIEAIRNQTYETFDCIICDNASTDGTEAMVKQQMGQDFRIQYYNTGENLGGAGGFSYGLKQIANKDYEYCWMMDDDSVPERDALERLIEAAELLGKENFSFLASTVLWTDGTPCKMNQYSIETNVYDNLKATQNGLLPIERCSFVGCFVNLKYTRKFGLPIKEFFIYGDDTEYTLRLSKWQNAYMCSQSIITHKMEANVRIGVAEAPQERLSRYIHEYRNRIYIYRKHQKYSWLKIVIKYVKEVMKVIVRSKGEKKERVLIILKGFWKGIFFNPSIEYVGKGKET